MSNQGPKLCLRSGSSKTLLVSHTTGAFAPTDLEVRRVPLKSRIVIGEKTFDF